MNVNTFKQTVLAAAAIGVTVSNAVEAEEFSSLKLDASSAPAPEAPVATTPADAPVEPKRGRGRPKGSKNKTSKPAPKAVKAAAKRGPGRPKGSKNKTSKAEAKPAKSSGQRGKPIKPGTSCSDECLAIVSASKEKMTFGEIVEALAAKKLSYPKVNVGVALKALTNDKQLVRTGKVRHFHYRAAKAASKATKAAKAPEAAKVAPVAAAPVEAPAV